MSEGLIKEYFAAYGNGFAGEISVIDDPAAKRKEVLYWHDGTNKLFMSHHYHFSGRDQIIIICSNLCFRDEGDEMAFKIHRLLNQRPFEDIRIKYSLSQYISEDVAMHAGIPAALAEYKRLKNDTLRFAVPGREYILEKGLEVAEIGDVDSAILIIQEVLAESPDSWQAYDALGGIYGKKGDPERAAQCYRKVLELDPGNAHAAEMLKKLEIK
jgi:tetratricopeptide (TPR) repeat protein